MSSSPSEALWTVREVSAFLRVSRSWIYQRTAAGELPHIRVGGLVRFVPDEIRSFATRSKSATVARIRGS